MPCTKANLLLTIIICVISDLTIVVCCRNGVILKTGISNAERQSVLDEHNRLRQLVALGQMYGQPGAENMQEMQWDDELAATAQNWANQCHFDHDPVEYLARFEIGQNLALMWSTAPLADDESVFVSRVKKWFNEVYKYAFGSPWSLTTGHYTQLVWSDSNLVGCGVTYYRTTSKYNKLFVCNYGPGGNINGVKPYETGSPSCENHGMIPSSQYDGLCTQYSQYQYTTNNNNNYDYNNGYYAYNHYETSSNNNNNNNNNNQFAFVPAYNRPATNQNYQTNKFNSFAQNQNQFNFQSSGNDVKKPITNYQQSTSSPVGSSDYLAFKNYRWDLLFKNFYKTS